MEPLDLFGTPPGGANTTTAAVSARLATDGPGWVVIRSATLGEDVLWLRDRSTPFPRAVLGLVRYTLAELDTLTLVSRETLQAIHRAKKVMGGGTVAPAAPVPPPSAWVPPLGAARPAQQPAQAAERGPEVW
jgi:hypothetical protein